MDIEPLPKVTNGARLLDYIASASGTFKLNKQDCKDLTDEVNLLRQQLAKPAVEPLIEALQFIKDGNCATLQGAILHASQAIAAYDASR